MRNAWRSACVIDDQFVGPAGKLAHDQHDDGADDCPDDRSGNGVGDPFDDTLGRAEYRAATDAEAGSVLS